MNQTIVLDKIRRLILLKTGIHSISPSDCKHIASSVSKSTKKSISETTIKRLFGFAETKSNFSRYTLSALLDYTEEIEPTFANALNDVQNLKHIQNNCRTVSLSTRKNLSNRSGIPYHLTVPRIFPRLDFDYFYHSSYSFMAIVSRAGYGKSTIMCHLVQQLLDEQNEQQEKDAILFVSARDIFDDQFEYTNLEQRIKSKIGLEKHNDLTSYFSEQHQQNGTKLLIFIDSFSELLINNISKPVIFDKLINLICTIGQSDGIKVVFTMRSNMWNRFFDRIRNMPLVVEKWFPGLCFDIRDQSNIPPLALEEIETILSKIDPEKAQHLTKDLKLKLKYPFFIQWYYLLKDEFPNFEPTSDLLFFEIVDRFIAEKIHHTSYATEKTIFCRKLTVLMQGHKSVPKLLLIEDLAHFKNAYRELLADGILMEEKQEEDGIIAEYVRFVHPHVSEYFIFLERYHAAGKKVNQRFFKDINMLYSGNSTRFQLMQWAAKIIITKGNFEELELLISQSLNDYEKKALIHFIAESLKYLKSRGLLPPQLQQQELHEMICSHLAPLDFVDSRYLDTVCALRGFSSSNKQSFFYLLVLSVYDCLSINKCRLAKRLKEIEMLQFNETVFSLSPIKLLQNISQLISGRLSTNPELSWQIEQFKQVKLSIEPNSEKLPSDLEMLVFVLMIIRENIQNPKGVSSMIDAMISYFPQILVSNSPFSAYFLAIMDLSFNRSNQAVNERLSSKIKIKIKQIKRQHYSTKFSESIYKLSKAYQNQRSGNIEHAINFAERCLEIFSRNQLRLIEVGVYELLSELYGAIGNTEKKNDYLYQKFKCLNQQEAAPVLIGK
ncbi:nSTAND1 domain-containing NTPase [Pedobacter sp.]